MTALAPRQRPVSLGVAATLTRITSSRVLGGTALLLTGWGVLLATTPQQQAWRGVLDVVVLTAVHSLAVLVASRDRHPGSPGSLASWSLVAGLSALAVAAICGRLLPPGSSTWLLDLLHLAGQLGTAVLLLSCVLRLRGPGVITGFGLDAANTTLGLGAATGTVVLLGIGDTQVNPATGVVLALTCVDVVLLACAVALFTVRHPGRNDVVPPILAGAVLLLAADLVAAYSVHNGGPASPAPSLWLTAAACLVLARAKTPTVDTTGVAPGVSMTDRLHSWSTALPFAGAGGILLALLINGTTPLPNRWSLLPVLAAVGCFVVVAVRFHLTVRMARSALEQLQDALTDPLTGLLNRRGLSDTVDRWLCAGDPVTLVAVDLDGFRRINEDAGHETGDRVLQRIPMLLVELAGPDTLVARIDGDDFALAFRGADTARASVLAREVRHVLGRPFAVDRHRLHLTANVGTATSHVLDRGTGGPPTTEGLLRCADQALADAQASTHGVAVHDPDRCGGTQDTGPLARVDDLHAALAAEDQLLLHFQPQHRIQLPDTGTAATIVGCEALLRWAHPTRGMLGPGEVLRAAEHGHLTAAVSHRVLDLALAAAAQWWDDREVPVAVNLTATDLDDELLPHHIADALDRHGLPARALTVEVVEDTLMLDPDRALQTLTALRTIGLRIAIDDYGTGYSSLAYLHRLPIDEVKFDRSLTAGISADPAAAVIIGHSIRLAHDLGLTTLAEGIEQPADLDLLSRLGCDIVQGYLTGRPQALAAFTTTLSSPVEAPLQTVTRPV